MSETGLSATETHELRDRLLQERNRIAAALESFQENGRRTVEDDGGDAGGVGGDTAAVTVDRELDEGLLEGATQTLEQIERALARLADGSYGTCERCGKSIPPERMTARPWATLCIDDQRLADRG